MEIIIVGSWSTKNQNEKYNQTRQIYDIKGIAPTLTAGMGMGGGTIPFILVTDKEKENDSRL